MVDWMVTGWSLEETRYLFSALPYAYLHTRAGTRRYIHIHPTVLEYRNSYILSDAPSKPFLWLFCRVSWVIKSHSYPPCPHTTHTSRLLLRPSPTHSLSHGGALALYSKTSLILEGRSQGKACNNTVLVWDWLSRVRNICRLYYAHYNLL